MSTNQSWYMSAPSVGVQRSRPGSLGSGFGAAAGSMSKPKGVLHGVDDERLIARARANSACGLPVIHVSVSVGAATGVLIFDAVYSSPLSRKVELVESWNC